MDNLVGTDSPTFCHCLMTLHYSNSLEPYNPPRTYARTTCWKVWTMLLLAQLTCTWCFTL